MNGSKVWEVIEEVMPWVAVFAGVLLFSSATVALAAMAERKEQIASSASTPSETSNACQHDECECRNK